MTETVETAGELHGTIFHDKIRDIILQELELEPDELADTGNFVEDYDADSLSLITIVARIEKELGVVVPKDELPNMLNLANVFSIVDRYSATEGTNA